MRVFCESVLPFLPNTLWRLDTVEYHFDVPNHVVKVTQVHGVGFISKVDNNHVDLSIVPPIEIATNKLLVINVNVAEA